MRGVIAPDLLPFRAAPDFSAKLARLHPPRRLTASRPMRRGRGRRSVALLRHAEHRPEIGRLLYQGKVVGRHGLQGEAALAAGEGQLRLRRRQRHDLIVRQRAQDVDQLSRSDRGREGRGVTAELSRRRTWISRSLVVNSICAPFLRTSTLARIGKVWRRSTMPATACSALRPVAICECPGRRRV